MASPLTYDDVVTALEILNQRAIDSHDWKASHTIAHVESALFGFDPDCPEGCPLA